MKNAILLSVCLIYLAGSALAQNAVISPERLQELQKKKSYETRAIESETPQIDGLLNDPAWQTVEWGGGFVQVVPEEGKPPSQETAFKILYDEKFLYVGFRCFDDEPDKIERRMSRRDGFEGDSIYPT